MPPYLTALSGHLFASATSSQCEGRRQKPEIQWDEGKDNFAKDPPNVTVSVLGGDGSKVCDAVVTLRSPKLEGGNLTFDVTVLERSLSGSSGPAALFIDHFGGFGGGFRGGLGGGFDRFGGAARLDGNRFG